MSNTVARLCGEIGAFGDLPFVVNKKGPIGIFDMMKLANRRQ